MPPRDGLRKVPTVAQVVPGAFVHIILKQDQPTGRTVQGTVQTVLTRGNHPRGIKVRLTDGRVGRVQSISNGALETGPASGSANTFVQSYASPYGQVVGSTEEEAPREQIGLDAYIRPGKPKKNRRGNGSDRELIRETGTARDNTVVEHSQLSSVSPTSKCPVCNLFEGDEAAVSHHVATHFDS